MSYYQSNPVCRCGRCSTRGLMGPAILITLGVLFLLANAYDYPFERTWPILLIVIGGIKVVRYVIPESGHFNPGQYPPPYGTQYGPVGQYPPASYQQVPSAGQAQSAPTRSEAIVTPPPAPSAGALGTGSEENGEVHNG
jgi:hypothetical protein